MGILRSEERLKMRSNLANGVRLFGEISPLNLSSAPGLHFFGFLDVWSVGIDEEITPIDCILAIWAFKIEDKVGSLGSIPYVFPVEYRSRNRSSAPGKYKIGFLGVFWGHFATKITQIGVDWPGYVSFNWFIQIEDARVRFPGLLFYFFSDKFSRSQFL